MQTQKTARGIFIFIFLSLLAITIIGWWSGSGHHLNSSGDYLIAFGRLFGLLATFATLFQLIIIGRIPPLEKNFSLEEKMETHKINGYGIFFSILAHVILLILGYTFGKNIGFWNQYSIFNTQFEEVYSATIGTAIFFGVILLSITIVRKHLLYELWHLTHLASYIAIIIVFGHQIENGGDFINQSWFRLFWFLLYIATFSLLGYWRILKPITNLNKHDFKVEKVVQETNKIVSIYIQGNNLEQFKFRPGQYALWTFLNPELWYEAHPFSFSTPPNSDYLRITVKASGDFTAKLKDLKPGTRVLIDGPRGAFTTDKTHTKSIFLIAGGIGIAPYLSTIQNFLDQDKKVTLLYSVKEPSDIIFESEISQLKKQGLTSSVFISSEGQSITPEIISKIAFKDATYYLCGPLGMSKSINKELLSLGIPNTNIQSERFSF